MTSTLLAKSAAATGAIGGIAGGAYLIKSHLFSGQESIRSKLEKEGWVLLSHEGKESEWTTIYGKYKKKETKDPSKLDETVTKNEADNSGIPKLKRSCELALSKEFSESLYKSIIRWCVTPVSVEERLKYLGNYTKINVEDSDATTDNDIWQTREATFKSDLTKNNQYLGVDLPSTPDNKAENIKKLKTGCRNHLGRKNYEDEFESSIEKVKDWCGK
ncbi:hypothetical protein MHF_1409 [Mycoplasma haemofelis Ohio2]|uniref:Uncharacterized protein n=1 Tax=Mycoplasma haemofelis (strain Ohio2) TaxID=859194 RepID=F6FGK5_MYCHI|nr:hypothetical protein MHF_1409 [Mycoplasma haemofelis Ohio2]